MAAPEVQARVLELLGSEEPDGLELCCLAIAAECGAATECPAHAEFRARLARVAIAVLSSLLFPRACVRMETPKILLTIMNVHLIEKRVLVGR